MSQQGPVVVFDPASALERLAGDEALLREVAQLYLDHADSMLAPVRAAVARQDAPALEHAAHTLKGAVVSLGGLGTAEAALTLEKMGRRGDLAASHETLARLEAADTALREQVQAWLAR